MGTFKGVTQSKLDPHKRINYVQGLVLGVDEFQQEQFYFRERDHLHQRGLHGYGTANGLAVTVSEGGTNPEVVVSPGLAIDPKGRSICVPTAQCARLNDWLGKREEGSGSPPTFSPVYIYACYRECGTDQVPIPSGPCKSEEESLQPSRIAESFRIEFSAEGPDQREELFASLLGRLLERIEVTDLADNGVVLDLAGFFEGGTGSPPWEDLESLLESSPPTRMRVHPDQLEPSLRRVLDWWITEVRPILLGEGCAGNPGDDCVLLARLDFETTGSPPRVTGDGVEVSYDERPYLLSTRVLQEWARIGTFAFESDETIAGEMASGDLSGLYPSPQVIGILDRSISLPAGAADLNDVTDGSIIVWSDTENQWQLEQFSALIPTPGGDVQGDLDNLRVIGLQGRSIVSETRPQTGQILVFEEGVTPAGDQWQIQSPAPSSPPSPIVAAGFFQLGNLPDPIGPSIGEMTLEDQGGAIFLVRFADYVPPQPPNNPSHTYVVKGTPVEERGPVRGYFRVIHRGDLNPFLADGILVKIDDQNGQGQFGEGGCMIEVTRIDTP